MHINPRAPSFYIKRMEAKITYGHVVVVASLRHEIRNNAILGVLNENVIWQTYELQGLLELPHLDFEVWIALQDGGNFHGRYKGLFINDRHPQ